MKDDNLWIWFSRYIRLRDSDETGKVKCFTCPTEQDWNSGGMNAGHFISRRHQSTKYHEKNVHAQCAGCNLFQSGKQYEYSLLLDQKYGEGTAAELLLLSRSLVKRSAREIKEMTTDYKEKARAMMKSKNTKYY